MTDSAQEFVSEKSIRKRLLSPWTITLGVPVFVAILDQPNFLPILEFASRAFVGTLPYILFAVSLIAYLKATGAETMIARAFQGRENRMIVFAALFGGLAPFCSCEVIPFVAGLLALGAPLSAVMAFWLSSPLIDPPTLLITAAALGWEFAIGKAVIAVLLGLSGGFVIKYALRAGYFQTPLKAYKSSSCCGSGPNLDGKPEWRFWQSQERVNHFRHEFFENALFLIKWLALAYVLEAMLVTYVPADLIANLVGGEGLLPVVVAAIVGMPAYLNSYIAPPLISGLMDQGMTAGAGMAFMVSGAVSSVPAMAAVWSLVQKQVFAAYICLGVGGAIISGVLFEMLV
ncbi:MAG: permease [Rhizobiaceae bacterium]|nr:permease [Rhizobiaceae bacterium]